jgi:hypothetical protein
VVYDVDKTHRWLGGSYFDDYDLAQFKKRPSIFMPKWAARIWCEVTGLREERLQDISELECWAEGLPKKRLWHETKQAWMRLWDSINAKRGYGWGTNPIVKVIEFKLLRKVK